MWMGAAAKQYSAAGFKREDQNGVGSDVGGENGHYGQPVGGAGAGGEGGAGGGDSHSHQHHPIPDFKPAPESLISGLTAADYMSTTTTGASMSSAASQPRKAHEGTSSAAAAAAAAASLSSSTAYPYYSPYGAGFAPKSSAVLSTAAARSPKQKARNTAGKKCSAIDDASN